MNTEEKMGKYADGQSPEAQRGALEIFAQFGALVGTPVESDEVQAVTERWFEHINKYYYDCTKEVFYCVGQFYPTDADFVAFADDFGKGTAQFMCDAIAYFSRH